jgi:hypothetical protein
LFAPEGIAGSDEENETRTNRVGCQLDLAGKFKII